MEAKEKEALAYLLRVELSKKDPWTFITEFCKTDRYVEEDGVSRVSVELIPTFEYLRKLIWHIHHSRKIAIPKSRRLMITWIVLAYCLWYALAHSDVSIYLQKIKEDDAGFADPNESLCSRIMKIYNRLPKELQQRKEPGITKKPPVINFKDTHSSIIGVAEGPDQIRGKGAAIIVIDEMSTIDEDTNRATLKTVLPIVDDGAKLIVISTARGQEMFYKICKGLEAEEK